MARTDRVITRSETFGIVKAQYHSTRFTRFATAEKDMTLLVIPQVPETLWQDGTVARIASLLGDTDVLMFQSYYSGQGVKSDLAPLGRLEECIKFVLDSKLTAVNKFIYLVALLKTSAPITVSVLEEILEKQPEPLPVIKGIAEAKAESIPNLVDAALYTNFQRVPASQKSLEDFQRISLITAFLTSNIGITYGEFLETHQGQYYVSRSSPMRYDQVLYAPINREFTKGLTPVEYVDFVRNFGSRVPSELRRWSFKRYCSGVVTNLKAQAKGVGSYSISSFGWDTVLAHLTAEESEAFKAVGNQPGGLFTHFRGADSKAGALFAFYFTEGGPDKVNQLAAHILANSFDGNMGLPSYKPTATLNWTNPYAGDDSAGKNKRVRLLPYVIAISDPERKNLPLELALLTL